MSTENKAETTNEEPGSDREIIISRVFNAPRELLWDALTDPRQMVKWWGPRGFTTTVHEMDVRPGGAWNYTMHGPDGADYPNTSRFTEVVKPKRIVYSHAGHREGGPEADFVGTWTFEALDDTRTKATIHMVFPSAEAREIVVKEYGAIEGGKQTLARLAEQLANTPLVIERVFSAPIEIVWKAISEKDQLKHWYFDIPEFSPMPGTEFSFRVEHEGKAFNHLCKVTEVVPGRKLAYTWRYEGHEGDSLVTFELFAEGGGTRVKLTHEGIETFPKTPDYARGNFMKGWTMILESGLKEFLSAGIKE